MNSLSFSDSLKGTGLFPLISTSIKTLQVNVGYRCNQACAHCHVAASPSRGEVMSRAVMEACLSLAQDSLIETLDITGGAPEMHPDYRWFVERASTLGLNVKTRTNLTILLEDGYEDLPEFLATIGRGGGGGVEVIASLPCFLEENVDRQRGKGTYLSSIGALKRLNAVGYGVEGTGLVLNLVYNPVGLNLPPSETSLQEDYKRELLARHNLSFTNLFTITNMPIGRFKRSLVSSGKLEGYLRRLAETFNPKAARNAMCREMLSVGYDGSIYDCDFNQVLGLKCGHGAPDHTSGHIDNYDFKQLATRQIVTGEHCYGCTAGAGSSCSGAVANG